MISFSLNHLGHLNIRCWENCYPHGWLSIEHFYLYLGDNRLHSDKVPAPATWGHSLLSLLFSVDQITINDFTQYLCTFTELSYHVLLPLILWNIVYFEYDFLFRCSKFSLQYQSRPGCWIVVKVSAGGGRCLVHLACLSGLWCQLIANKIKVRMVFISTENIKLRN